MKYNNGDEKDTDGKEIKHTVDLCNIIHSDIPKWLLFTQDVVKEHIIIDRAVISNENESIRLALNLDTIRNHAKEEIDKDRIEEETERNAMDFSVEDLSKEFDDK
ncbi:hypothetical protein C1646_762672 [Rhizophagus diaphanus]|nr:hypothetical protein C1646_762672 [Rhizophagus diaphanus] [Rhizophagus sp. MUCL 43196]